VGLPLVDYAPTAETMRLRVLATSNGTTGHVTQALASDKLREIEKRLRAERVDGKPRRGA
jgi:hypothetical protein